MFLDLPRPVKSDGVAQLWVLTDPAGDGLGLGWLGGCMLRLVVSSLLSHGPEEAAHRFPILPSQQGDPLGLGGLSSRQSPISLDCLTASNCVFCPLFDGSWGEVRPEPAACICVCTHTCA